MKANLIMAEMDPSRIGVACRAVTHELIPGFQAQRGAGCGYWMVNRTNGEVLVLTTWRDEAALEDGRAGDRARRTNVAERTGLGIRAVRTMDVLDADDARLMLTAGTRWVRTLWFDGARREDAAHERGSPGFCGGYVLSDPATDTGLALSFWADPPGLDDALGSLGGRSGEFESVGVAHPQIEIG